MGTSAFDKAWGGNPPAKPAPSTDHFDALWHGGSTTPAPAQERGSWADALAQGLTGGFASDGAGAMSAIGGLLHGDTHLGANYVKGRDQAVSDAQAYAKRSPGMSAGIQTAASTIPTTAAILATGGEGGLPNLIQGVGSRMLGGAAIGAAGEQVARFNSAPGNIADRAKSVQAQGLPLSGMLFGAATPALPAAASTIMDRWAGRPGMSKALGTLASTATKAGRTVPEVMNDLRNAPPDVPVVLADGLGEPGRRLVRSVTDNGAMGADDLRRTLAARGTGQFDRWRANTQANMGQDFQSVPDALDAATAARRTSADAAFGAANMNGMHNGPVLQAAMENPDFQKAIKIGQRVANTRSLAASLKPPTGDVPPSVEVPVDAGPRAMAARTEAPNAASQTEPAKMNFAGTPIDQSGLVPPAPPGGGSTLYDHILKASGGDPVKAAQAMRSLGEKVPPTNQGVVGSIVPEGTPTGGGVSFAALDNARQFLRKGIQSGFDAESGFNHTTAGATHDLLNVVMNEARTANPQYGAALDQFGEDSKPINALENAGKNFFTNSPDENAHAIRGLAPDSPEMNAIRTSAMSDARNNAGKQDYKANIVNRWLNSPDAQKNLSMIAPTPEAAAKMQAFRDWEQKGALVNEAPGAGSKTSTNLVGLDRLGSATTMAQMAMGRTKRILATAIGGAIDQHNRSVNAEALAPMLSTPRAGLSQIEQAIAGQQAKAAGRNAMGKISAAAYGLTHPGNSGQNQ